MRTTDLIQDCPESNMRSPQSDMAAAPAAIQHIEPLTEEPVHAVWAGGLIVVAWFLLVILQSIFGPLTVFNATALFIAVAALIGTAAYLVSRHSIKLQLIGGGVGVVAAILGGFSTAIARNIRVYGTRVNLGELFSLRDPLLYRVFGGVVLGVALALIAAWLVSLITKTDSAKRTARLAGLCAAVAYLGYGIISSYARIGMVIDRMDPAAAVSSFIGAFADAACVFLVCLAVFALCNMQVKHVKLRGIGLVWAWLAAVGMAVSLVITVSAGIYKGSAITYTLQFVLSVSGLTGYILLLCKRHVGLYVILLGVGAMLGAQLETAFLRMLAGDGVQYLISTLLAMCNPLFAYLAVRAALKRSAQAPQASIE